jgi:hypothetical protein
MMFRTDDGDMAGLPGMFGEGLSHWHAVSRVLETHWFHVTIDVKLENRRTQFSQMVNDEFRLHQIILAQDLETRVTSVQVVTPPRMNKTPDWKMEKVLNVTLGNDQDECTVCVLEVDGGGIYHDSFSEKFEPLSLTNLRRIFHHDLINPKS